jgi:hypothetical protein
LAARRTVRSAQGAAEVLDIIEMPALQRLRAPGLDVVDGQQVFPAPRRTKTADKITLLTTAASMVDAFGTLPVERDRQSHPNRLAQALETER